MAFPVLCNNVDGINTLCEMSWDYVDFERRQLVTLELCHVFGLLSNIFVYVSHIT